MQSVLRMIEAYANHGVEPDVRRLLLAARVSALVLGAIRAWACRHVNNPGGISHLDIADAYMRGDFHAAVNGSFSPLYSLLLGPALRILRPGASGEAAVAHLVNFFIYCGAMVAFDVFLRAVIDRASRDDERSLPGWLWVVFGYATFTWSSLMLIGVADLTGDLLMSAFVYGAAAIIVRMQIGPVPLATGAALGLVLGLGYLAKAAMFPLAGIFFAVALLARFEWRGNAPTVAAAVIVFAIVVAPFVVALSLQKGRPTTGEIGKLVYAWFVNGVTKYAHWQGEPPGRGVPVHPDRKIHEHPDVFEYATPIIATHAVFYDPSYWYEGLETHVDARNQMRALLTAARVYWQLAMQAAAELLVIAVLLFWRPAGGLAGRLSRQWFMLIPAVVPFAMFAIVHTEPRFVGEFLVIGLLGLLLAVRVPDGVESRRMAAVLMIAASVVVGLRVTVGTAADLLDRRFGTANYDYDVAVALQAMGVRDGDRVGTVGWAYDAYWARLAHLRIIAEVPAPEVADFWSLTPDGRQSVYEAFRRAGVRCLVTDSVPHTAAEGWRPVGRTNLFAYFLEGAPGS